MTILGEAYGYEQRLESKERCHLLQRYLIWMGRTGMGQIYRIHSTRYEVMHPSYRWLAGGRLEIKPPGPWGSLLAKG